MWERHELETFLTLADELHFGRTAERSGVSTGQVSRTIQRLERRVGAPLFERTSRQVRLTSIGRRLAEELAPVMVDLAAAIGTAVDAGRGVSGILRVGYMTAGAENLLLRAVELFAGRHGDCDVQMLEAQIDDAEPRLRNASIDVLVAAYPFPGMTCGPVLMREPRVLAVPAGHDLARRDSVSIEILAEHPVIQLPSEMAEEFRQDRTPSHTPAGFPVPEGPVGTTFAGILSLVAMGKGVYPVGAHTERYYPRSGVAYVPMHDAPPVLWGPVWLPTNDTAMVRAFVQAARDANPPEG
ncbi:DNA-binding transcriptional regulator, LysR family [Blastococcus sp. DSM 46786]|uniref:LysR family transcriptional regulator n=1 Tax=Blastococcus sp. DSM 46786 TaxID=1798227 RepID=UPI0008BDB22F|nr:LysR family transcriptional regulator [Blastococcus sp. DSM 46786]SEL10922.1 DNA-binding transcriptional regulator, LysR family [Blastococcus sp. DSM 46786]